MYLESCYTKDMRIYYIDFENVGFKGLEGIETLTKNDKVIIFIYKHSSEQEISHLKQYLKDTKAKVVMNFFKVHTKNSLDFKICTELGIQAMKHKREAVHFIVSHDKGYIAAIEHMESMGEKCKIVSAIKPVSEGRIKPEDISSEEILSLFPDATKKYIKLVRTILVMSLDTSQLNTNIQKLLHDREAYGKLKSLYLQKACY